jgi:hypothetical protein
MAATKVYGSTSPAFQLTLTAETKTAHSSGHPSRTQMVPAVIAQFIAGQFSTADSGLQAILDAKVTAGIITLIG